MDLSANNWSGTLGHEGLCVPGTSNWGQGAAAALPFMASSVWPDFPLTQNFKLFCIVTSLKHGASAFFPHKLIIMEEMRSLSESISDVYSIASCLLRHYLYICTWSGEMKAIKLVL